MTMKIIAHIFIMIAFGASIYLAFGIARDVQQNHRNPKWDRCPMCLGRGVVPPLPEKIE